jgi:hypothetical protein
MPVRVISIDKAFRCLFSDKIGSGILTIVTLKTMNISQIAKSCTVNSRSPVFRSRAS